MRREGRDMKAHRQLIGMNFIITESDNFPTKQPRSTVPEQKINKLKHVKNNNYFLIIKIVLTDKS